MFKRIGDWIGNMPWWALLIGGPILIVFTALMTAHFVSSDEALEEAAPTPELRRAVQLERERAARELGLKITKYSLEKVERVVPDPEARADIEEALREVEHAMAEIDQENKSGKKSNRRKHGVTLDLNFDKRDLPLGPLPELSPEIKQQIRDDLRFKVYKVGFSIAAIVLTSLLFLTLIPVKIGISINRALKARAARSQAEADRNKLEKQLVEARLAALQAQIEPHFLFNTLASVQQLIDSDPQAASRMQANLIKYLRAAVPRMRDSSSTLAQEVELAKAYLQILKIRMEERLQFDFAIPIELENVPFPPMMIATLVENAIKHGLEPKPEGGRIDIYAREEAGKLRVTVADDGMGFSATPGSGVGLANIRERLDALYGKAAALVIEDNAPHGTKLTIEIPGAFAGLAHT